MSKKAEVPGCLKRDVLLEGLCPILVDRYAGDNNTQLAPEQKLYRNEAGAVVLPSLNIMSALSAQNTMSWTKRLMDSKQYKRVAQACLESVLIEPTDVPFLRNGKPLVPGVFVDGKDAETGIYIRRDVARLDKGIPNPKARPVLGLPWALRFSLSLYENDTVKEEMLRDLFIRGGLTLGLGTFRGVFGKFKVALWE